MLRRVSARGLLGQRVGGHGSDLPGLRERRDAEAQTLTRKTIHATLASLIPILQSDRTSRVEPFSREGRRGLARGTQTPWVAICMVLNAGLRKVVQEPERRAPVASYEDLTVKQSCRPLELLADGVWADRRTGSLSCRSRAGPARQQRRLATPTNGRPLLPPRTEAWRACAKVDAVGMVGRGRGSCQWV